MSIKISKQDKAEELRNEIKKYFDEHNYNLITDLKTISAKANSLHYICCCGDEKHKSYKDILLKVCRSCKNNLLKEIPTDFGPLFLNKDFKIQPEEEWIAIKGGFLSNQGRLANVFGKLLTIDEKGRYYISGETEYITILMAKEFKIKDYEKLQGQECQYIVRNKLKYEKYPKLENLYVGTRTELGEENGKKSRQSEEFKEKMNMDLFTQIENYDYKIIPELPNHKIFEDGNIYINISGSKRFITGSNIYNKEGKTYKHIAIDGISYYIHRLICYTFHPIEGKKCFQDYKELEVNHKDGNTLNNHKDNLEWVTHNENMQHSYKNNLNKKVRNILQYDFEYSDDIIIIKDLIAEYISIAEASRKTGIKENEIRDIAKNNEKCKDKKYLWKFKNESETKEYSKKYTSDKK
jgi:hypothetical protein